MCIHVNVIFSVSMIIAIDYCYCGYHCYDIFIISYFMYITISFMGCTTPPVVKGWPVR